MFVSYVPNGQVFQLRVKDDWFFIGAYLGKHTMIYIENKVWNLMEVLTQMIIKKILLYNPKQD